MTDQAEKRFGHRCGRQATDAASEAADDSQNDNLQEAAAKWSVGVATFPSVQEETVPGTTFSIMEGSSTAAPHSVDIYPRGRYTTALPPSAPTPPP